MMANIVTQTIAGARSRRAQGLPQFNSANDYRGVTIASTAKSVPLFVAPQRRTAAPV